MSAMNRTATNPVRRRVLGGLIALPLAACGSRSGRPIGATSGAPAGAHRPAPPERPIVELQVQSNGDLLEFTPKELQCAAGVRVRLMFHHTGRYVNFMHNWVLLRPGTYDAVIAASEAAGETNDWLPTGHPGIIAATPMCGRGKTVVVEFDAPPAGRYLYICTTPGHAQSMWGVLTVTPA